MYKFENFQNTSNEKLTSAWNSIFSDYSVPMNMSIESLEAYLKVSGVDKSLSFGVFYKNKIVGMMLNSVGIFKGNITQKGRTFLC